MNNPSARMRIFSGIQPSGVLTLANYLCALKRFVELQDSGQECVYCIVDLHAITVWQDPGALKDAIRHAAAAFLAAGIDPGKSILFNQSQVSAHAELAWVFNCVARMGWMGRMTQFKEKAGRDRENASVGLFTYPSLMAADILVYHATHVPVGDDQKQHLELTRDIAIKFNHDYRRDFFPVIEPLIEGVTTRIMSLRDGTKKMSKSDPSDYSRINLSDSADQVAKKIRRARSDAFALPGQASELASRPEARNLLGIYALLGNTAMDQVLDRFGGKMFSQLKGELTELAVAVLGPISAEMNRLVGDPAELDRILGDGAERAASLADPILQQTYDIVGMLPSRRRN
ncbi:MAG: tryptophan--tRNA ligase [Rhodobacteraceae bacterium]|nr:tryptophan--tRNA ligase [Paracoccaceae bacterium]